MAFLHDKVRALREKKGWTLQEAADAAKLSNRQQWYQLEAGLRPNPTLETLKAVADALGVKVCAIIDDK